MIPSWTRMEEQEARWTAGQDHIACTQHCHVSTGVGVYPMPPDVRFHC